MAESKPSQSQLWEHINQTTITTKNIDDLTNFKSGSVNHKLALWNPQTNGVRYLKALIYNLSASLSEDNWDRLQKTKNRDFGNPLTVNFKGYDICLDYLQAVHELEFINENINLTGKTILEIGAGYGRTCHTILSNHDIKRYFIIDLDNCLLLAKKYLEQVLDNTNYLKIHFISITDIDRIQDNKFDLAFNIDSLAEMEEEVVKYYLEYIANNCSAFYVKNPVGKYLDKSLNTQPEDDKVKSMALNTGVLRDVIDIHNNHEVEAKVKQFKGAYKPGNNWQCSADSWAIPWSYYWQAFYKKRKG
ncbi:MAG: putative sugar O-methyltransferase [Flavobacteriales bacterium]|nr:putative sugar O-methyltransferase [Flavobacteriales bacterium]